MRRTLISAVLLFAVAAIAACSSNAAPTAARATSTPMVQPTAPGIANPASVFCEQNGGKLEFRQDAQNGTTGICVLTDKSECEEWAYYRGECKPGDKPIMK